MSKGDENNSNTKPTPKFDPAKMLEIMNSASSKEELERLLDENGFSPANMATTESSATDGSTQARTIEDAKVLADMQEFMVTGVGSSTLSAELEEKIFAGLRHKPSASKMQEIDVATTLSDEVQEIMGYIPNWITRWGITTLAAFIIILLMGSWYIEYPDTIPAQIKMTTNNPPAYLRAKSGGKLTHLLVKNNQLVRAGVYLAVLENTADHQIVFELKHKLDSLDEVISTKTSSLSELHFKSSYDLGDLQSRYETFLNSLEAYRDFREFKYFENKSASVKLRRYNTLRYVAELVKQQSIVEQELGLSRQNHGRVTKLRRNNLISNSELESSESALLQKEHALVGANTGIIQARIQLTQLDEIILDLEHEAIQKKKNLIMQLRRATERLQSGILSYEETYILISPVDGVASLTNFWSENQNVAIDDDVLAVIPKDTSNIIGKIELPMKGAGKVKEGQIVNVKLANYPYQEFGMIIGVLKSISLVPAKDSYILTVKFPDGLETTYGKELQFSQGMMGTAEIITDDLRLLDRLLGFAKSTFD